MQRCAYLTMRDPGDFVTDYDESFGAMARLGWEVETVVWDDPSIDWENYQAVYICTPWDYPDKLDRFIEVLEAVDRSSALLVNELALVRWNLRKTYLRDVEAKGGAIVPSLWLDGFDEQAVAGSFAKLGVTTVVIKPQVGANAVDTFVVNDPVDATMMSRLGRVFAGRACFVQPFMHKVRDEGEYSLFYFDLDYSHAILKTPAAGDFRSQEEHGAEIAAVAAPPALLAAGEGIMKLIEPAPVYARADFVRDTGDRFLLMELELIEPSLYLRTDANAAGRFAAALDRRVRKTSESGRRK